MVAVSLAGAVVAVTSATGPGTAERIKAAMRAQTNCADIVLERPSTAAVVKRWASRTSTGDVVCGSAGLRVAYAQFTDSQSLAEALAAREPPQRYCVLGAAIVLDEFRAGASIAFTDICQSLGGTFVDNNGD